MRQIVHFGNDAWFWRIENRKLDFPKVWRAICGDQILACQIILISLVVWLGTIVKTGNKQSLPSRTSIGTEWKWISPELWPDIPILKSSSLLSTTPSVKTNRNSSAPIESSRVWRYRIKFIFTLKLVKIKPRSPLTIILTKVFIFTYNFVFSTSARQYKLTVIGQLLDNIQQLIGISIQILW